MRRWRVRPPRATSGPWRIHRLGALARKRRPPGRVRLRWPPGRVRLRSQRPPARHRLLRELGPPAGSARPHSLGPHRRYPHQRGRRDAREQDTRQAERGEPDRERAAEPVAGRSEVGQEPAPAAAMEPLGVGRAQPEVPWTTRRGGRGKRRLECDEVGEGIRARRARGHLRPCGRGLGFVHVRSACREGRDDREIVSGVCGGRVRSQGIGHVDGETGSVRARFRIIASPDGVRRGGADRGSRRQRRGTRPR